MPPRRQKHREKGQRAELSDLISASAWARNLSREQLQRVTEAAFARDFRAGAYVCRAGQPVEHWTGVIDGLLKVSIVSASGRLMTLSGITTGGWFGEGSLLKTEPRRYDAITLRATRIAFIPRATFRWLCEVSIPFNRFLVNQINERCGQFIAMLQAERLFNRDARVAHCIWVLFNPYLYPGVGPYIRISQEEIGHLAGLSRQQTNSALHVLEQRGLLRVEYGGITVTDLQGLGTFGSQPNASGTETAARKSRA